MQISRSLFPVGGAYKSVQSLNQVLQKLQVQLATQEKAATLSELGTDRVFDLTLRSRLSRLEAFGTNIDTTTLRLDFLDNAVTRLNEIEGEVRGDLSAGGIGSDGISLASATQTSYARLDEVLAILNSDLNGRQMFAGNRTDSRPVVNTDLLLDGDGTHAGLKQLISERKRADAGGLTALGDMTNGHGRVDIDQIQLGAAIPGALNEVVISESATPNGPSVTGVATTLANPASVTVTPAGGAPAPATVAFAGGADLIADGDQLTVNVQRPGGLVEPYTFTAVTTLSVPPVAGEFAIVAGDENATAANFNAAFADVFQADTVTVAEDGAHAFGIKLNGISTDSSDLTVTAQTTTQPHALQIRVDSLPQEGETITVNYALPDGSTGSFEIAAVTTTPAQRGEFTIGADTDATAANIATAIATQFDHLRDTDLAAVSADLAAESMIAANGETPMRVVDPGTGFADAVAMGVADPANTVIWYSGQSTTGSARQTASARVDESTTAYYGVLGNEQGIAELVRATAVMAAESFSTSVTSDSDRFQALAQRQVVRLAEMNNGTSGSIEVIALELGLAQATVGSASERHATYGAQLETMLSEIESVDINEVAMQLLAVRTNLEASYQTMARLADLQLVNFMS
ncbi:MAG: hypothetical protein KKH72_14295 [Alphaproteobacteria bacterium]|nr:hypothetical protein [Alphaproteobacteria bacterium]